MRSECPKCGSQSAWIETTRQDTTLRCVCGYLKVLSTKLETIEIIRVDVEAEAKLPRRNSNLWNTVKVLEVHQPASSASITQRLNDLKLGTEFTVSDVSSYLTILRSKGLVVTTESRRGLAGGSTWKLSDVCNRLLGVG
ncbi:hypothetical protein CPT_Summit_141 [Stenotrophomonas phage Summit]|nr:hypothetical protein CPT_Summit_141 [Stenotrophomonas phage Summit]